MKADSRLFTFFRRWCICTIYGCLVLIPIKAQNQIAPSHISAKNTAKNIVRNAVTIFENQYAENYICSIDYTKLVYSADSLVQIAATIGIWGSFHFNMNKMKYYWEDLNLMGNYLPIDSFCTNIVLREGKIQIPTPTQIVTNRSGDLSEFDRNYSNTISLSSLDLKRCIELYSPLNIKHLNDYKYSIITDNEYNGHMIEFTPKSKDFPRKSKLYCQRGILCISPEGIPTSIIIYNAENRYSSDIYIKGNPRFCITPYTFKIDYCYYKDKIYTKQVCKKVNWETPVIPDEEFFFTEYPPYRKPFQNKICINETICFSTPLYINDISEIKSLFPNQPGGNPINIYSEGINIKYWQSRFPDIKINNNTIADLKNQAELNTINYLNYLTTFKSNNDINQTKKQYHIGRELFFLLYNKQYYEN